MMFRAFVLPIAALAAGFLATTSAFAAQKVVVGDTAAATSIVGRTLQIFKENAEKYSDGDLQVQVFSNSQLGDFGRMATQMKIDQVNVMFIQPDALGQQSNLATVNAWPFM